MEMRVCVCACVCVRARMHVPLHTVLSKPRSKDTLAARAGPTTQILIFKSHMPSTGTKAFWRND